MKQLDLIREDNCIIIITLSFLFIYFLYFSTSHSVIFVFVDVLPICSILLHL